MNFVSYSFAIFFMIIFIAYWIIPSKYQWILLLAGSYYFYMCWNPRYVILIFGVTIVSYISAILICHMENERWKKNICIANSFICLGVLFFYKS